MKILVLYKINYSGIRNTVLEHLYCFKKYVKNARFHYFNVIKEVPDYLTNVKYDAVILHYTLLTERFSRNEEDWKKFIANIGKLSGYKAAIPQDEYDATDKLCYLFKEHNIKTVFTCFTKQKDYIKAYPRSTGLKDYVQVLTGYVDEEEAKRLKPRIKKLKDRTIDIGYRGRKLPYYFGHHGQLKFELANIFSKIKVPKGLIINVTNTGEQNKDTFIGKDWYGFLLQCKAFLGCEGGSSLLDPKEEIKKCTETYTRKHPDASFSEVKKHCFSRSDNNISCFAISPRHFEAAMTKTLQILIEGDYNGIFIPNTHYLELKKDYSNLPSILEMLKNEQNCQKIVNRAYKDIVESGKYSYKRFAETVFKNIKANVVAAHKPSLADDIVFLIFGYFITAKNFYTQLIVFIIEYAFFQPLLKSGIYTKIKNNQAFYNKLKKLVPIT